MPNVALQMSGMRHPFSILNHSFFLIRIARAKKAATKFLKKHFCNEGKSPESLTNAFINAKQNADNIIKIIPLYLDLIFMK